jgi:hypothetical protein
MKGEGNKKTLNLIFTPLLPAWEKGLGDEGEVFALRNIRHLKNNNK